MLRQFVVHSGCRPKVVFRGGFIMTLRINSTAPDFKAETTQGPIEFHKWIGDGWAVLFSQADIRTHLIHRPARDIIPPLGGTPVSSYPV
jgi:hypothetical protein